MVDRDLGRADRQQPLLRIPVRATRVGDPDDDPRDVETPLGDLRDDEVGVVAAGRGQEHVGVLDPRLDQGVDLERGADRESAAGVLPGRRLILVEPLVRERIAVQHRHLVPRVERALGDGRPDAT